MLTILMDVLFVCCLVLAAASVIFSVAVVIAVVVEVGRKLFRSSTIASLGHRWHPKGHI